MVNYNVPDELADLASNDIEKLIMGAHQLTEAQRAVLKDLVNAQQEARRSPSDEQAQTEYLRVARIYYDTYLKGR